MPQWRFECDGQARPPPRRTRRVPGRQAMAVCAALCESMAFE
jgi:hypothetical protein